MVLAAGDSTFTREIRALIPTVRTVSTKQAVGGQVARLLHPEVVQDRLREGVSAALGDLRSFRPLRPTEPVTVRMRFDTTTRADIVGVIPGVKRIDGTTVEFSAPTMRQAYPMVRLMYRYVSW